MAKEYISALAVMLIVVSVTASVWAIPIQPTLSIPGCIPSFELNVTGDSEVYPNSIARVDITIQKVMCGLSHAALYIDDTGFEKVFEPEYFAGVPPSQPKTFKLKIEIPADAELGQYEIPFFVMSNEKRVETEFTLNILPIPEPVQKPKPKIIVKEPEPKPTPESEPTVFDLNKALMVFSTSV